MTALLAATVEHGTDSVLEYTFDWTHWLRANEDVTAVDAIVASDWSSSDPQVLLSGPGSGLPVARFFSQQVLGKTRWYATTWVGPIAEGNEVVLTNRITTALGRVEEQSIKLVGVDR